MNAQELNRAALWQAIRTFSRASSIGLGESEISVNIVNRAINTLLDSAVIDKAMEVPPVRGTPEQELWDIFGRHKMNLLQGINLMVASTKALGETAGNEVEAFALFLDQAKKICPALKAVAEGKK